MHPRTRQSPWLTIFFMALFFVACGGPNDGGSDAGLEDAGTIGDQDLADWPEDPYLSCEQVRTYQIAADPRMLLLNVVDEEFYNLGHIEGSLIIPWDLLSGRLAEVNAEKNVLIYCRRGVRSESAYSTLENAGYEHIWIMESGIERWIELGYPTVNP